MPQGLPRDPQCIRPRCGEGPTYLVTTQVHLYGAGTNERPVQQSYTLTGSACIGPAVGKLPEGGTRASVGRPPPQPCLATSQPTTRLDQGAHLGGRTGGKGTRKGRGGGRKRGGQLCRAKCRASVSQQRAGRATESTRSPMSKAHKPSLAKCRYLSPRIPRSCQPSGDVPGAW